MRSTTVKPELLDFLLATGIPKQSAADWPALTDNRRSGSFLEEIEKRDLFLRRTDPEGTWFQYHHLFAEYLLHRLERDAVDRIPDLHRRAAQWFAAHQMLSQAVDHLLLAGDAAQAVDAVEAASGDLNEEAQMTMLIGLAAKLPAQLPTSPRGCRSTLLGQRRTSPWGGSRTRFGWLRLASTRIRRTKPATCVPIWT